MLRRSRKFRVAHPRLPVHEGVGQIDSFRTRWKRECRDEGYSEGALTHILYDILGRQVIPPQTHPTQRNANSKPGSGEDAVRAQALKVRQIPAQRASKTCHLPCQAPYAGSDDADLLHEQGCCPRGADFEDAAAHAGNTDVQG